MTRTMIRALFTSALIGAVLSNPAAAEAGPTEKVTIRATSALPDPVIAYIADISVPQRRVIPPRMKPETFMAVTCGGTFTKTYETKFYELNPTLERMPVSRSREVLVPACAQYRKDVLVPVRTTDTLETIVKREIGIGSTAVLRRCDKGERNSRCDRSIRDIVQRDNPGVDVDNLKPGSQLKLPVVSKYTTFAVKPTAAPAQQVSATIAEMANKAAPGTDVASAGVAPRDIDLIAPQSHENVETYSAGCKSADSKHGGPWPFDVEAVVASLLRNRAAVERSAGHPIRTTRIAVLDTGLQMPNPVLVDLFFDRNVREIAGDNLDNDANGFTDDHYGIDNRGYGKIAPHDAYPFKAHGLHVADLVTGGATMRKTAPQLQDYLRLKIVHLVAPNGDSFEIKEGAILKGLQYSGRYSDIVNLSIGSQTKMDTFQTVASDLKHLLLVVAAGNDTKDLNMKPVYPAAFGGKGGELRHQVITVAGHGADGELADFSNFSDEFVDIAAPGCAIVQAGYNSETVKNYGTSVAAPLVTFTAALVRSLGLQAPFEIKNRLIASARYVPKLRGFVGASGVLDIAKAVSLYEDVLEVSGSSSPLLGQWVRPTFVKICAENDEFEVNRIKKITRLSGAEPRIRLLYQMGVDERLREYMCTPHGTGLKLKLRDGGETTVAWAKLHDFVPGLRLVANAGSQ
jgi:subtilisin family serine protease